jgi:hypothetical protein
VAQHYGGAFGRMKVHTGYEMTGIHSFTYRSRSCSHCCDDV